MKRVVVHEQYNRIALYNDIALLILSEPVSIRENIGTICIPSKGASFAGNRCTVSGWGKDNYDEGQYQVRQIKY